jgi:hypothetical protein
MPIVLLLQRLTLHVCGDFIAQSAKLGVNLRGAFESGRDVRKNVVRPTCSTN